MVGRDSARDEESGHIAGAGCRQSLSHQILDNRALERCHEVECEFVAIRQVILQLWFRNLQQSVAPSLHRGTHVVGFNVTQNGSLDAAIRKIKARTVIVGFDHFAVVSATTIAMLDLGWGKFHRSRVAVWSESIDGGAPGISQAQELGAFNWTTDSFESPIQRNGMEGAAHECRCEPLTGQPATCES